MAGRAFSVDDFLQLQQPTFRVPMHLSPDGHLLSLTVAPRRREALGPDQSFTSLGVPSDMAGSRVLVIDTMTGEVHQPFGAAATSWGGVWSPDGRCLAAYVQDGGSPCPAVWDRATGDYRKCSAAHVRPFFGFEVLRWTPDSTGIVAKLLATARTNQSSSDGSSHASDAVRVYSYDPQTPQVDEPPETLPGWADGYICDLGFVDLACGDVRILVRDWHLMGWEVAPHGRSVAVLRYVEVVERLQQFYYDLVVVPLDGSVPTVVATRVPQSYGICMAWSPDGDSIAFTSVEHGQLSRLFVVPADGRAVPRDLTAPDGLTGLRGEEPPRWSADGRTLLCATDDGHLELAVDGTERRYVQVDGLWNVLRWLRPPCVSAGWQPLEAPYMYIVRDPVTGDEGIARIDSGHEMSTLMLAWPKHQANGRYGMEVASDGTLYLLLEGSDHPAELWCVVNGAARLKWRRAGKKPPDHVSCVRWARVAGNRAPAAWLATR